MSATAADAGQVLVLVRAIEVLYERMAPSDPAVAGEIARVRSRLRSVPAPERSFPWSEHPIVRHLASALAARVHVAAEACSALGAVGGHLPWRYGYARRDDAPELGDRIAFAESVGPEAPFRSDTVCLGVTLIAPRTLYPEHRHPAIELYHVLSGTAAWSAGGSSRVVPPGSFVLHPSGVVHAMRTDEEPLLAVYTWTGEDVRTTSVYV